VTVQTKSELREGFIVPPTVLEITVADHCNLTCRQCNHGSPVMAKWSADPAEVARDLAILKKYYRPRYLKFIGGEPLLHPDLAGLIRAVIASGIGGQVEMVTNGTLLARMSDELWRLIRKVQVSYYPAQGDYRAVVAAAGAKARAHGVEMVVTGFAHFRDTFSTIRNDDDALVRRVYKACHLANVWGIHALYRGRIYKCPQSTYVPRIVGRAFDDGLPIRDAPGFQAELLGFLNSPEPLESCRNCVGTSGKPRPHAMLARNVWREDLARPATETLDWPMLDKGPHAPNIACEVPVDLAGAPRR
jgi:organic radical activating enzyme